MKNFSYLLLASIALHTAPSLAQIGAPEPLRNVVQLSAAGSMEVQQDWLSITLSTTREGADPALVQSQLKQVLELALLQAKATAQAQALEVKTGAFSLQPRYGRDGKISTWSGYTELVLEGRDIARIGAAAGRVQGLTIAHSQFGLSRELQNQVEAKAQEIAIDRFKTKANDIARGFGFSGYTLREVSVGQSDAELVMRPRLLAAPMKAASNDAPVPLEAGKSTVQVQVSGSVQLR
jgi:predicted secreted protein